MKKSFLSLAGLAMIASLFVGVSGALNLDELFLWEPTITDYQRILQEYDSSWWYNDTTLLSSSSVDWASITLESPTIEDWSLAPIPNYQLFVSPYRVSQLRDGDSTVDPSQIVSMRFEQTGSQNVSFSFSEEQGFNPSKIYYGFISPLDDYDDFGTPSNEFCFVLGEWQIQFNEGCDALELLVAPVEEDPVDNPLDFSGELVDEHGAADCVGMDLANVTHTIDSNVITLRWTSVGDPNSNVEIAVFNPVDESYQKLADVKMSAEKYAYKMQWNGEFNFLLTNSCGKEVRYKVDAAIQTPDTPEIVPPATGPAENIFMIIIAAIVVYGAYTIFFRKSE